LPSLASAQETDLRGYDGYCYSKTQEAKRNGTIIGVVTGGLIGSQISKNERGLGAAAGAVIGGVVGNKIGKNSTVKCYKGEYYSYQGAYYDPAPAPKGYTVVFYKERPSPDVFKTVYYDTYRHTAPPPYSYNQAWQNGKPSQ
jgi:hypothetical protein